MRLECRMNPSLWIGIGAQPDELSRCRFTEERSLARVYTCHRARRVSRAKYLHERIDVDVVVVACGERIGICIVMDRRNRAAGVKLPRGEPSLLLTTSSNFTSATQPVAGCLLCLLNNTH